jgi:acetoacetyl-CoA synthetase
MGTSEIYRAVLALDDVMDAVAVDVPIASEDRMLLFVVLREGCELTEELATAIRTRVRNDCSPRHVPNEIHRIEAVPRTLSGKAVELPIKRILMGLPADTVVNRESLANPEALVYFERLSVSPGET